MITLLYHQIDDISSEHDPLRLAVSPEQFSEQMDYLKKNDYCCVSLEGLVDAKMNVKNLPDKSFAITFDDGYSDNYEQAFPLLQKYNFTATIFLVTSRVGKTVNWDGVEGQDFPLMSWSQIREMSQNGIQFGSHTHTHPRLSECSDKNLEYELVHSKYLIEKEIDKPANMFAYPYESVSPGLEESVSRAGYQVAFGSLLLPENRFNLWRRECFGNDSLNDFRFKLSKNWRRSILLKYHSPVGKFLRLVKRKLNL